MKRLAVAAALLVSCSNDSGVENLPPKPENGVQILLPEMTIEPAADTMTCWHTRLTTTEDVWVRKFEVFQGQGGHHIVGFITDEDVPAGTVADCSDPSSMALWRPLLTGTDVNGFDLPEGYAVRVPAGARLVFQTHYVNATDNAVKVRDVVNLHYADDIATLTPIGSFANTTVSFQIPASADYTAVYECAIPQALNVFLLFGHMHERGTRLEISAGPPGALQSIYTVDPWEPQFRDVAPKRVWSFDAPLALTTSDVIRVSCSWHNETAAPIGFPSEMCASVLWVYPTMEPLVCTADPL